MLRRRILTKSTGRLMNFMKKNKQKMSQNWELGVCLFFLLVFFERPPNLRLKNTGLRQAALRKIKSVCWFTLCPIKKRTLHRYTQLKGSRSRENDSILLRSTNPRTSKMSHRFFGMFCLRITSQSPSSPPQKKKSRGSRRKGASLTSTSFASS